MLTYLLSDQMMILFLILALGALLGGIAWRGVSLGTAGVFFVALVFGHFGMSVPKAGVIIAAILVLAGVVWAIVAMSMHPDATSNIRDIFIIFMAFESLVIGAALVILIIQIASLINLLQNEVKPILQSTNETVNTLRGTTEFLSENMVEPVIKLNSYLAGLRKFFDVFGTKK